MTENDIFDLTSYSGVNNARFGMTPKEIEAIFGLPDIVDMDYFQQREEFRLFMNVAYSAEPERAIHFGFGRQMKGTKYNEISLFTEDPNIVLRKLIAADGNPQLLLGFVIFLNLGLTLTGFHDNDESQKAVTLFERGFHDESLQEMKPFRLRKK
ncbi:hypothetical protein [Massilia pseudoviolaceinigra]|uniref:hypothetical protein n=1 Tax=Massilia pseudoviolaceinigra TaxID=3057165 RepID=UPI0027966B77|nr:hypothetical protein [Massilia sp. CCM 9206]MDQ1924645.1 hypothetical protein [Massilia sp. CCM 9206]